MVITWDAWLFTDWPCAIVPDNMITERKKIFKMILVFYRIGTVKVEYYFGIVKCVKKVFKKNTYLAVSVYTIPIL